MADGDLTRVMLNIIPGLNEIINNVIYTLWGTLDGGVCGGDVIPPMIISGPFYTTETHLIRVIHGSMNGVLVWAINYNMTTE